MTNYFYTFDVVANDHRRPNVQSLPIKEQNTSCILSQDVSIFLMRFLVNNRTKPQKGDLGSENMTQCGDIPNTFFSDFNHENPHGEI